jgi:hypothetical protein
MSWVGVTYYSGPCAICESEDFHTVDALIRLDKHVMEIYRKHPHLVKRDINQHKWQCLQGGDGDGTEGQRPAQRLAKRTAAHTDEERG